MGVFFLVYPWIEQTGCCELVLKSLSSSVVNWEQVGVVRKAERPEEANLLIIGGWINPEQAQNLKEVYDRMLKEKLVIAVGSCALSAAAFGNDENCVAAKEILPVHYFVPGCPPRWDDILKGISAISKIGMQNKTVRDILNDSGNDHVF